MSGKLKQHNFRLDEKTDTLLGELAATLGVNEVDVIRLAIRKLARRELSGLDKANAQRKQQLA